MGRRSARVTWPKYDRGRGAAGEQDTDGGARRRGGFLVVSGPTSYEILQPTPAAAVTHN